jgi:hypothetical protein
LRASRWGTGGKLRRRMSPPPTQRHSAAWPFGGGLRSEVIRTFGWLNTAVLTIGFGVRRERHHGFGVAGKFPVRICHALQAPIQIIFDVVGFAERGHFAALDAVVSRFHVGVSW